MMGKVCGAIRWGRPHWALGLVVAVMASTGAAAAPVYGGETTDESAMSENRRALIAGAWLPGFQSLAPGLARYEPVLRSMESESGTEDGIVLESSGECRDAVCATNALWMTDATSFDAVADPLGAGGIAVAVELDAHPRADATRYALD